ncbi:hypothetical protein BDW72DRAFT_185851 [Aspergillus terricola var. indicus]
MACICYSLDLGQTVVGTEQRQLCKTSVLGAFTKKVMGFEPSGIEASKPVYRNPDMQTARRMWHCKMESPHISDCHRRCPLSARTKTNSAQFCRNEASLSADKLSEHHPWKTPQRHDLLARSIRTWKRNDLPCRMQGKYGWKELRATCEVDSRWVCDETGERGRIGCGISYHEL